MIEIAHTNGRLTIGNADVKAGFIGASIVIGVIGVIGGGLVGCGLLVDYQNSAPYRDTGLPYTPITTILFGAMTLLSLLWALFLSHSQMVLDRAQGTLRLLSVRLFGTTVRREVPLASIRTAQVTGSRGAFWQLEIALQSGETLEPDHLYSQAYQPDELQKIAEQVNQFLAVTRSGE